MSSKGKRPVEGDEGFEGVSKEPGIDGGPEEAEAVVDHVEVSRVRNEVADAAAQVRVKGMRTLSEWGEYFQKQVEKQPFYEVIIAGVEGDEGETEADAEDETGKKKNRGRKGKKDAGVDGYRGLAGLFVKLVPEKNPNYDAVAKIFDLREGEALVLLRGVLAKVGKRFLKEVMEEE